MLYYGAQKETAKEIRNVLGYEISNIKDDKLKSAFQKILNGLENKPNFYTLASANSVLSDKEFSVKKEYKSVSEKFQCPLSRG
ncbi:hypothetical protein CEXT_538281 [Caerostris extrusa]|uniref:Serpin domain-containing protein n=1 Tax=Caerostris extrusa TaxID=172846 RepID=A0AAV4SP52_CAEEX|nr:hypothetical protein CEXT_538281 [Caerostris extrusa]